MGVDTSLKGVSDYNQLQVVKSGVVEFNTSGSGVVDSFDVAHNLGYIPKVMASLGVTGIPDPSVSDVEYWLDIPGSYLILASGSNPLEFADWYDYTVDTEKITFFAYSASFNTVFYKYILLRERTN